MNVESGASSRIRARENSPALNRFLEDVLSAQNELRWIDRAVSRRSENFRNVKAHRRRKSREYNEALEDTGDEGYQGSPSLVSLKRTIAELRDSLDQHGTAKGFEPGRKLLSASLFQQQRNDAARSAMGIAAIEYYDYVDDADTAVDEGNQPMERDIKHQQPPSPPQPNSDTSATRLFTKMKNENDEEDKKKELLTAKLKNKTPKEEFLSDIREPIAIKDAKQPPNLQPRPKHLPEPRDSDSSDYSQWNKQLKGLEDHSRNFEPRRALGGEKLLVKDGNDGERDERVYLVLSPRMDRIARLSRSKKTSKRSVERLGEEYGLGAYPVGYSKDKSARNYAALKSTDDLFKGGIEQSNPLGGERDKPGVLENGSPVLDSNRNNLVDRHSTRYFGTVTTATTTEWKIIKAIEDRNDTDLVHSARSPRGIGRHLTSIIRESKTADNSSTGSPSSVHTTTQNRTTGTSPSSGRTRIPDVSSVTKNPRNIIISENATDAGFVVSHVEEASNATTRAIARVNARPRRHATSFGWQRVSERRKRRTRHRRRKNRQNLTEGKGESVDSEAQRRKLTALLAAENIEDESQINLALHGELASKIVEKIFEQVQRDENLKVVLGPGLYRRHKPQESMSPGNVSLQGLDRDELKETEAMMRRVMDLLGRLVVDEVRRKTCASLDPDTRDFLQWTLGLEEFASADQVPPLAGVPAGDRTTEKSTRSTDKFLFPNSSTDNRTSDDLNELARKVNLLKGLIKEYNALSERERTKVHTVRDYLVRQLSLLMKYIESRERDEKVSSSSSSFGSPKFRRSYKILHQEPIASYIENYSRDRKKRRIESRRIIAPASTFVSSRSVASHTQNYRDLLNAIATLRRNKRDNLWLYEIPRIYVDNGLEGVTTSVVSTTSIAPGPRKFVAPGACPSSSNCYPLPVRGKNRLEDEILLLNKREAWRKENRLLLEEVAFGKDTRNDLSSSAKKIFQDGTRELGEIRAKRGNENSFGLSSTSADRTFHTNRSIERIVNVFPIESTRP